MSLLLLSLLACRDRSGPADSPADSVDSPVDSGTDSDPQPSGCSAERVVLGEEQCVAEAACAFTGGINRENFGHTLEAADADGDGAVEVWVGAPGFQVSTDEGGAYAAGRVVLLPGSALSAESWEPETWLEGGEGYELLGWSTALVPDVNGDGLPELAVGAIGRTVDSLEEAGAVDLILSDTGGLSGSLTPDATWTGATAFEEAGFRVAGWDPDSDGVGALWVSHGLRDEEDSWDPGTVSLLTDPAAGGSLADADLSLTTSGYSDGLGHAFAVADFDGDGHEDTVVGAPYGDVYKGEIWLIPGGQLPEAGWIDDAATAWASSGKTSDAYGWVLAAVDLEGDGVPELAVGAPLNDDADSSAGSVHILQLQEGAWVEVGSLLGSDMDFQLGAQVAAGTGMAPDGADTLLVGEVNAYRGFATKNGQLWSVAGIPEVGTPVAEAASSRVMGAGVKDYLGGTMLAADLDQDGASDLLVGVPLENQGAYYDQGVVHVFFGE